MFDDHFGEGMGYLMLFAGFFLVVAGSIELTVIHFFLERTARRIIRLGVPIMVLIAGFLLLMRLDALLIIFGSILFSALMAALIPALVIPDLIDPASGPDRILDRILICYIAVSLFTAFLLFVFSLSGLSMVPAVFWHTTQSNAIIFAGVFILDSLAAFFLFRIMQWVRPVHSQECGKNL
jgi:hypothetical protein